MYSALNALRFGTVLVKKAVKCKLLSQTPTTTEIQNLRDGSIYTVGTDQFKAMNTLLEGSEDVYTSKSGQWRDFKIVPRGTVYKDLQGRRHRADHGILIRELSQADAYYEPSLYYAVGGFVPEKGNAESMQMYQEMLNIAHLHGPLSPAKMRGMAQSIFYNRPFVLALAGYSDADSSYAKASSRILTGLVSRLGAGKIGFVTSPTTVVNSIDASGTLIAQKYHVPIVYVTAQGYIQYIDTQQFAQNIDKTLYSVTPKFFGKTQQDYSKATAEASNVCVVMGGRNAAVEDAMNALKKGNKVLVFRDAAFTRPAWDPAKKRVDNASRYLSDQLYAYQARQPLLYESKGGLNAEALGQIEQEHGPLNRLIKFIDVDTARQNTKGVEKRLGNHLDAFLLPDD